VRSRARLSAAFLLAAALILGTLGVGCGGDDESKLSVEEGEPLELGDLTYNISITRFLNPGDVEDKAYLSGQPELANDKLYLAVFMQIENESDESQPLPEEFRVIDTEGTEYRPLESESLFALSLDGAVPADGELPEPNTPAETGPIEGAMLLFLVDDLATENRPLELEVPSSGGQVGKVELDI
jgi:hypothetical protein